MSTHVERLYGQIPAAVWSTTGWAVLASLAFISTAVIYRVAGPELYGVWAVIVALKGFAILLQGGLQFAASREAARADDAAASGRALAASHGLALAFGLAIAVLGVALGWVPAVVLGLDGGDAAVATAVMMLAAVEAAIAVGSSALFGIVRGRARFDAWAISAGLSTATGVLLILGLVPAFGLVGGGAALLAARLVGTVTIVIVLGRWGAIPTPSWERTARREAAAFAMPLWLTDLGTQVGMRSDVLIVGFFFGAIVAGDYSLGAVIPALAASMLFAIVDVAFPRLVGRSAAANKSARSLTRLGAMLAALGFGVIALEAAPILLVWTGAASDLSISVARIYALAWALNVPSHVLVLLLVGRGQHRFLGPLVAVEAAASLLASLALAAAGVPLGPALATLVTLAVSNLVVVPWLASRRLDLALGQIGRAAIVGYLQGGIAAVAAWALASLGEGPLVEVIVAGVATIGFGVLLSLATQSRVARLRAVLLHGGLVVALRQAREARRARSTLLRMRDEVPDVWIQQPEPLVTVRIATYNRGQLVADRAIASALAQTHRKLEVVVVGDHCDEATERAVRSVADARVRFFNLPERGNYPPQPERRWMVAGSVPMNHAVTLAKGAWLAPLDDDDEFTPDHVEVLLDGCRSGDLDFAYGKADMEVQPGVWAEVGSWPIREGQIVHATVLYSMRLAILRHDVESWRLHEPGDWNLWHRMRSAGARMGFVDRVVARHYLENRETRALTTNDVA